MYSQKRSLTSKSAPAAPAVGALPKTRSGKTLRAIIRKIADGEDWTVPPTIEDPAVLDDYTELLLRLGYANAPAHAVGHSS